MKVYNHTYDDETDGQRGNVLFLILIAVVLFAALSYAVTQSSRTGGGDAGRETNLIASAEISQYPAAVKTAIVRMIINGTTYEQLKFNPPSAFADIAGEETEGVFHPLGGASVFQNASPDMMVSATAGVWYFNENFEVLNIGTSDPADGDGNEFIAFLPGIRQAICTRINEEVGLGATIPNAGTDMSAAYEDTFDDTDSETISTEAHILGSVSGTTSLAGQPFGCFRNNGGDFVYYQVLAER